jgi:hypothetical protein
MRRPSPATVIACIALFFAVAGGSAIALKGRNTVDSGDIKKGQVKTSDIANNAVTTKKIKNNGVRTGDIQNGQVRNADLAPSDPFHKVGTPGNAQFNNGGEGDCIWSSTPSLSPPIQLTPAAYFKDRDGVVHLAGNAVSTAGAGGDAMCGGAAADEPIEDQYAFILPPGYRPQYDTFLTTGSGGSSVINLLVVGSADLVTPVGTLKAGAVYDLGNTGGFFLESLTFRAAGTNTGFPRRARADAAEIEELFEHPLDP